MQELGSDAVRVLELEQELEVEKDLVAKLVAQLENLIEAEISARSHSSWWEPQEIVAVNRNSF